MTRALAKPDERVDDLQRNGLFILQKPSAFCFGMDAVLLADFARLRRGDRVADLGTGTGILPLLMSQNEPTATFEAIELQPEMADMAARSVRMNGLDGRVCVRVLDLRRAADELGEGGMDFVVCNPPYAKRGGAVPSETEARLTSKHETECDVDDIARAASRLLRAKGRFAAVFPAQRLLELCDALRRYGLEPKRVRMVCARADKAPYLALVEAAKGARPSLVWLPTLVTSLENGEMTNEVKRIYHLA